MCKFKVYLNLLLFLILDGTAICNECKHKIRFKDSTNNLRTHLYHKHNAPIDILYASQRRRIEKNNNDEKIAAISSEEKRELHNLVFDCVIEDSRTFSDFRKRGIRRFLEKVKPGYKPPCRQTIAKHLKKK